MLSAETAAGQYPYEAVNMMDRIVERVERDPDWRLGIERQRPAPEHNSASAIAAAARQIAHTIDAACIAAFTEGGTTAIRMARERPDCPVLGITSKLEIARRLAVVWGVHAVIGPELHSMTEAVTRATRLASAEGFAALGDEVVVTAGIPFNQPGTTNALRVERAR